MTSAKACLCQLKSRLPPGPTDEVFSNAATRIELGTSEDDTAARVLYESAGFTNREGSPDGPVMFFYEREL